MNNQIASGKYEFASEGTQTVLRVVEQEEDKSKALVNQLKIGEKSGKIGNFDRRKNLKKLHEKHKNSGDSQR